MGLTCLDLCAILWDALRLLQVWYANSVATPGCSVRKDMTYILTTSGLCNVQHVDDAIVKAILGRRTKNMHDNGSSSDQ